MIITKRLGQSYDFNKFSNKWIFKLDIIAKKIEKYYILTYFCINIYSSLILLPMEMNNLTPLT